MIDETLWNNICTVHTEKIGSSLFSFLFLKSKPAYIDTNIIIISIDNFSLKFFDEDSDNYSAFFDTCAQLLFKTTFLLKFIAIEDTVEYLKTFENDTTTKTSGSIINTGNNLERTQNLIKDINTINSHVSSSPQISIPKKKDYSKTNLINSFTFNNFFYSYENKQIITASKLVIENLDNPEFNPLFIYGISGIGKTHILNAIGNEIFEKTEKQILYLRSTEFIDEYTSLFKGGLDNTDQIEIFKKKYDEIDILLFDDIQLLEYKEGSLNEFFSIFEKMRNSDKMIILASDKHPEKIKFQQRLITRFLSGLSCEMKIPDSDTKKEIFNYYAKKRDFKIENSAIDVFISNSKNVRELIGNLNSISLYIISDVLVNGIFTKEDALSIINDTSGNPQKLTDEDIIKIIANFYNISIEDIHGKKRHKNIVNARHFSAYFLRKKLKQKHIKIAYNLGFKDHTAAINAIKQAEIKSKDEQYKEDFEKLSHILNN